MQEYIHFMDFLRNEKNANTRANDINLSGSHYFPFHTLKYTLVLMYN